MLVRATSTVAMIACLAAACGGRTVVVSSRSPIQPLAGLERQSFIGNAAGSTIEFDYDGYHEELLTMTGPADVQGAARQMAKLTDAQWRDAFRAANHAAPGAERYIGRIKEEIADGIALRVDRRETIDGERR